MRGVQRSHASGIYVYQQNININIYLHCRATQQLLQTCPLSADCMEHIQATVGAQTCLTSGGAEGEGEEASECTSNRMHPTHLESTFPPNTNRHRVPPS